jgi:hypothetical protein
MSNYEIGAYEALQWTWKLLRNIKKNPNAIQVAQQVIDEKLKVIGAGNKINFRTH